MSHSPLVQSARALARPLAALAATLFALSVRPAAFAAVQADPARISAIAAWLAPQPAPIGAVVTDRVAWTALAARLPVATLLTEADKIVNTTTPNLPDDLFLTYSRTGNRTTYETPYNTVIAQNDDWAQSYWKEEIEAASARVQAFALTASSKDAALLLQLPPGSYTVFVAGKGTATGVALGEVYALP